MTNPQSVASLDVAKIKRVDSVEAMLRKHMQMYDWSHFEARAINDFILTVREGVAEDFARALASALAGMEQDSERLREMEAERDRVRAVHVRRHERLSAAVGLPAGYSADATIDAAIKIIDAARAALPQETSADA